MNESSRALQVARLALLAMIAQFVAAAGLLGGTASSQAARTGCRGRYLVFIDARTGAVRGDVQPPTREVTAAVADGRGGWYVGGGSGFFRGRAQPAVDHLNQNGSRDSRFRLNASLSAGQIVKVLARHDSVLYAGGHFGVAAIDAGTGKRLWLTQSDDGGGVGVSGLAVGDGVLYAVGTFTRIGGVRREGVAALDPRNGKVLSWSVKVGSGRGENALAVAVSGDTVFLGGQFERLDGRARPNLGAVDARTGQVTSWKPAFRPADYVEAILVAHGEVLAGGHNGFAAFDLHTGRVFPWTRRVQGEATIFAVSGSTVYLGGNIEDGFSGAGDRPANNLAAVQLPAGLFTSWRPRVNRYVGVAALAVSGHTVLAGGFFGQSLSC